MKKMLYVLLGLVLGTGLLLFLGAVALGLMSKSGMTNEKSVEKEQVSQITDVDKEVDAFLAQ